MIHSSAHTNVLAALLTVSAVGFVERAPVGRRSRVYNDAAASARGTLDDLGDGLGGGGAARANHVVLVVANNGLFTVQAQTFFDSEEQTARGLEATRNAHQHQLVPLLVNGRKGLAVPAENVVGNVTGVLQAALAEGASLAESVERICAAWALAGVAFIFG